MGFFVGEEGGIRTLEGFPPATLAVWCLRPARPPLHFLFCHTVCGRFYCYEVSEQARPVPHRARGLFAGKTFTEYFSFAQSHLFITF